MSENADAEIMDLLRRMETDEQKHAAYSYMQIFRMQGLDAAVKGKGMKGKEAMVRQARDTLRKSLRKLLGLE